MTVKLTVSRAVALLEPVDTSKCVAAAPASAAEMGLLNPTKRGGRRVRGRQRVRSAVFSVAENVPSPSVKVTGPGSTAAPSVLVNCTVPV